MAMFKIVATLQLKLLYIVLLLGSIFRVLPANSANACGPGLYVRLVLAHHFLILATFAAAILLETVRVAVNGAEAASIAAARAAAGAKDFDAKHEAAVAAVNGVGSIAVKWHRVSLRALLLLAVVLAFTASFLAVVCIEDGFLYVNGCDAEHAGYGMGSPMGVVMMVGFSLLHGRAAWAAVFKD